MANEVMLDDRRMAFMEHIGELRTRMLRSVMAAFVCGLVAFFFASDIIWILKLELLPVSHMNLHTFTLGEAFFQELKVAIVCGLILSIPFVTYQIWAFIAPALVLFSRLMGQPLDLAFSLPEVAAVAISVLVANQIAGDGESNWLEGALLIALYAMLGFFFFHYH